MRKLLLLLLFAALPSWAQITLVNAGGTSYVAGGLTWSASTGFTGKRVNQHPLWRFPVDEEAEEEENREEAEFLEHFGTPYSRYPHSQTEVLQ